MLNVEWFWGLYFLFSNPFLQLMLFYCSYLFLSMSSSSWDTWLRSAEEHLGYAERLLRDGYDELAYEKAVYSGECALKAVLVKNGKFSRKDWTHDQRSTVKKIRDNSLLDSSLIDELDDLVSNRDGVLIMVVRIWIVLILLLPGILLARILLMRCLVPVMLS